MKSWQETKKRTKACKKHSDLSSVSLRRASCKVVHLYLFSLVPFGFLDVSLPCRPLDNTLIRYFSDTSVVASLFTIHLVTIG